MKPIIVCDFRFFGENSLKIVPDTFKIYDDYVWSVDMTGDEITIIRVHNDYCILYNCCDSDFYISTKTRYDEIIQDYRNTYNDDPKSDKEVIKELNYELKGIHADELYSVHEKSYRNSEDLYSFILYEIRRK